MGVAINGKENRNNSKNAVGRWRAGGLDGSRLGSPDGQRKIDNKNNQDLDEMLLAW